jgi:hypothetical protein
VTWKTVPTWTGSYLFSSYCSDRGFPKAMHMQRIPPATERLSHNFLGETFVSIFTVEKERQALLTHTKPTDLLSTELEHSASRSGD